MMTRELRRLSTFVLSILVGTASARAGGAIPAPARPDTYEVVASGLLFGKDYSRDAGDTMFPQKFPLANVRVDIFNSNNDFGHVGDDLMGSGYTDKNGFFSIKGKGKDWWQNGKPDVYARIALNDGEGLRVVNELDWDWVDYTPEHDNDNVEGNVWLGTFVFGTDPGSGGSTQGIFDGARRAIQGYKDLGVGSTPFSTYTIIRMSAWPYFTPNTSLDSTRWPTGFHTGGVSLHEFGHAVRHSFDAPNGNIAHWWSDEAKYNYARTHSYQDKTNNGFAFNEGWAHYWRGKTWLIANANPSQLDFEVEGNVAFALQMLADTVVMRNGQAGPAGRAALVEVLRDNPGTIHSFDDFKRAFDAKFPVAERPRRDVIHPAEVASYRRAMGEADRVWAAAATRACCTDEEPVSAEVQTKMREAARTRVQWLAKRASEVGNQAKDLEASLRSPPSDPKEHYDKLVQVITLKVNSQLFAEARKALESQLALEPPEAMKRLGDEGAQRAAAEMTKARRDRVLQIYARGLGEMIESLKVFARSDDPAVREFMEREKARLQDLIKNQEAAQPSLPELAEDSASTRWILE